MKALLLSPFLLLNTLQISLAQIIGKCLGAQATAMGKTLSVYPHAFATFTNPALLPQNKNKDLHLFQEMPFLQKDMVTVALSYQTVHKHIFLSPALAQYGNAFFKQHLFALGLAQTVNKQSHLGITLGMSATKTLFQPNVWQPFVLVGTTFQANKWMRVGSSLVLVKPSSLTEIGASSLLSFAVGTLLPLDSNFTATFEYQNNNLAQVWYKTGLSYQSSSQFSVQVGCVFPEVSPSCNVHVYAYKVHIHIGFSLNRNLGTSPMSELHGNLASVHP